jgi:hypothetical protein
MKELEGADRIANNFAQTACLRGDEIERLRAEVEPLRIALGELRTRLHAAGRRPEECYEMRVIDDALGWRAGDE